MTNDDMMTMGIQSQHAYLNSLPSVEDRLSFAEHPWSCSVVEERGHGFHKWMEMCPGHPVYRAFVRRNDQLVRTTLCTEHCQSILHEVKS